MASSSALDLGASLLPNATLLAASWNEEVAHAVGGLLAEEAERQHVHVVLGPTVNLHRSPLGGRLFEAFSEDPLLTGRLAAAYVRGLQERGIGACVKHLVANESETQRHTVDSVVDERTLREVYLLPFEIAVADADPWSVMAAYNLVNGHAATEQDDVNNGILKREWGWDGLLVSDWFATTSTVASANGGLDLVMPGPNGPWGAALVAAVEAGEVSRDVVDDHARRLLRLAERVGALGEHRSMAGRRGGAGRHGPPSPADAAGGLRDDRAHQRRVRSRCGPAERSPSSGASRCRRRAWVVARRRCAPPPGEHRRGAAVEDAGSHRRRRRRRALETPGCT